MCPFSSMSLHDIQVFDWCFTSGRGSNPSGGVSFLDHVPFKGGYGVAALFL